MVVEKKEERDMEVEVEGVEGVEEVVVEEAVVEVEVAEVEVEEVVVEEGAPPHEELPNSLELSLLPQSKSLLHIPPEVTHRFKFVDSVQDLFSPFVAITAFIPGAK